MLDAVRVAARWVSRNVLARLSARASVEQPPGRYTLIKEFCLATKWYNRRGELAVSSANVALKRLEQQGLVRLPPPRPRCAPTRPRQLRDDGQALPPLPRLPHSADQISQLHLQLLSGQNDPDHLLWNRLITREHPLGGAPLVGAQLRYLIRSDEGIIGAFGVGPSSPYLQCRDRWIGWDYPTRQGNLHLVIGLARFLIRPGIGCSNLASRCYSLVLSQVAQDWQERYGLTPVLVETFVDRRTQTGVSLAAANWRRLGQSRGGGRSRPALPPRPKVPKDVWVCELTPKAREVLQCRPVPLAPPRSVFHPPGSASWMEAELDGLDLGSERLERRFLDMLTQRWQHPSQSFGASFHDPAGAKAAYRFVVNSQAGVNFQSLLEPHRQQTLRRMAAESVVVLAQDTTTLSYNSLAATEGLGPVGDKRHPGRGLFLHSLQAFRTDRLPLGCAWAKLWVRTGKSDTTRRPEQSIDEKESVRWLEAFQAACAAARAMPQTQVVVCGDRESDIFELLDQTTAAPKNLHLLVRAEHDRLLESGQKLWAQLLSGAAGGTLEVEVPRRAEQPARTATLELRWREIEIAPPRGKLKKSWQPIRLWAVMAREINPPTGVEGIEWVLLTDWKVDSLKMARRMVKWDALRWGIECWHKVIKQVYGVETRQLKSARALERALVLDMITGWRALLLCRLGKEQPQLPASVQYSAEELAVLEDYKKNSPRGC